MRNGTLDGGFDGREPIYVQIADRIRHEVLSGTLKEDDQVMSTTQYATTYRINPATAAKAFAELVDEGVLFKKRGIGMFVSPNARALLADQGRERFFADVVEPMIAQARMLGIPLAEVAARITEADITDGHITKADMTQADMTQADMTQADRIAEGEWR